MGVPRSSYYAVPQAKPAEDEALAEIRAVAEACPAYGYRRVGAELRHRGRVVNDEGA
jgi:putative transposase